MADSPLTRSLAALSRFFVGDGTLQQTLARVTDLTVEAIEPADLAGITMVVEGRQRTAVFTDETAPQIDQAHYDSGEGPCIEAFHGTIDELWIATMGIGGSLRHPAVADIATGQRPATPREHDTLAVALNEYLVDRDQDRPVALWRDLV